MEFKVYIKFHLNELELNILDYTIKVKLTVAEGIVQKQEFDR